MLTINVNRHEFYDEQREVFFYIKEQTVRLEHSLISMSKWESHYKKPFLPSRTNPGFTTYNEELFYISCMIIGNVDSYIPVVLMQYYSDQIREYIQDVPTATKVIRFGNSPVSNNKTVTTELIYYWMIKFGIPSSFDKWHFNRLLTLLDLCHVKETEAAGKNSKMSSLESAQYRHDINKMRRGV